VEIQIALGTPIEITVREPATMHTCPSDDIEFTEPVLFHDWIDVLVKG
jgi:hypothetical protein